MPKLVSNLSYIARNVPGAASAALKATADDVVTMAKDLAPVRTGNLRDSYQAEPQSEDSIYVGTDVLYAPFQEFGTYKMGAQPHFMPALLQAEETFKVRLLEEVEKLG